MAEPTADGAPPSAADPDDDPDADRQRRRVRRGLAWVGAAAAATGVVDIVTHFLVLALWISPSEYGIAALAIPLFMIFDLVTDLGLSAAVIQRDDHTPAKIATVFWLNAATSLVLLALLLGVIAPGLAAFHHQPLVGDLLRLYGIKFVFQNVYFIPGALMRRELRFRELSLIRIVASVAEHGTKVALAASGAGPVCFVWGALARVLVTGVGIQRCHPWRPALIFRPRELGGWISFGFNASISRILFFAYTSVDVQLAGKLFGDAAAGLYRFATDVALEVVKVLSEVVTQVAFPTFARLRYDRPQLLAQFLSFTRLNLVVLLLYVGVIVVPTEELLGLIGPRYVAAADILRILSVVGVLRALSFIVPPLLDGIGRPGLTVVYMAIAAVVVPAMFLVGAALLGDRLGVASIAVAWAVGYPIAFAALLAMALAATGLTLRVYLARIIGIVGHAGVAIALGWLARLALAPAPAVVRLIAVVATVAAVFLGLLARFEGLGPRRLGAALQGQRPARASSPAPE